VVNRVVQPLSRLAFGAALHPIETGRAAIASLLVARAVPDVSVRERQALRAYQDYLERNPEAPGAERVIAEVEKYQARWLDELHGEALQVASTALAAGRPEAALVHLDRADRLRPGDPRAAELRARADRELALGDERLLRSLEATSFVGLPLDEETGRDLAALAQGALIAPPDALARTAGDWNARRPDGPLEDEALYLAALETLLPAEEDRFFEAMHGLAELDPERSNMQRHARAVVFDPEQNPHAHYEAQRSHERRQSIGALLLGSRARGAAHRGLWRPLEWLLDLPGFVISFVTFPLRLVEYPELRARLSGPVIHAGEQYLARFPYGAHAQGVHGDLEELYAARGEWSQALTHQQARVDPDPAVAASYRERAAQRMLEAAGSQRRVDVRLALYRAVVEEYPGTPQASEARRASAKLIEEHTPQSVRLSKAFLEEHPELLEPDAFGIRAELLDGDDDDGELAEEGITLVGRNLIRVPLVEREPLVQQVPPENFQRAIALLEEIHYRTLATDPRERPAPDPQRDLFFEQARLGVLDRADPRPSAASAAVFESTNERHGLVTRRESVLPVELVLSGGLEDFAFSAFPRVREPGETPDAFLYR
jgi:hypothetical protein